MKHLAVRATCYGALTSVAFAVLAFTIALIVEPLGSPIVALYVLGGVPLATLWEHFQFFQSLQWRLFPEGGPGAAMIFLFADALISWAFVFSVAWWLRLRAWAAASNNSFKPRPLRGSA